jgi:biopolymer transport protein ExbB/TolQ
MIGLVTAFVIYLLADGFRAGLLLWIAAGLALLGLMANTVSTRIPQRPALLIVATTLAAALALAWPLGTTVLSGAATLPSLVHQQAVWPQVLVLLFASRVFSEATRLNFVQGWLEPVSGVPARTQSVASALTLGAGLTLVFYFAMPEMPRAASQTPAGVMLMALTGSTPIHTAIIFLFFVIVASLLDAAMAEWREEQAFRRLLRAISRDGSQDAGAVRSLLEADLHGLLYLRTLHGIEQALKAEITADHDRDTLMHLHSASRRFLRALIPLLPLLGFLGTVIGLATALGQMPQSFGGDGPGEIDLARSLAGLSIKFETTLLGLIASMVASVGLAILERHEMEREARTARFIESLVDGDEGAGNDRS